MGLSPKGYGCQIAEVFGLKKSPFGGFSVLKSLNLGGFKMGGFLFRRVFFSRKEGAGQPGLDEPMLIRSSEEIHLSFLTWRQLELKVQLVCDECQGRSRVIKKICYRPQRVSLDEDCFFCGRPLFGEVIFL